MKTHIIRSLFLDFFKKHNHQMVKGSPIVPYGDDTLLFTNAGMNQFKDIFLGVVQPEWPAATTTQRCIRAGGKHNDLNQVGYTKRHLTCFEMLGNFSFIAYFKEKAIIYAWEFLTEVLHLSKDLLWVTVYREDNEAFDFWKNVIGIPAHKIIRLDEKDNFWQMGDMGPCGPCSEIYYDCGIQNEALDRDALPGSDESTRFLEVWNLVFIQYNRSHDGILRTLETPGIDTGMGLERIAKVMQGVDSVFDTDGFQGIIKYIEKEAKIDYSASDMNRTACNVIADHIRSTSCIIAEGIFPSNEGRGYVLRKIMRRLLLFAKKINLTEGLGNVIELFLENSNLGFNDLSNKKDIIIKIFAEESERFFHHLIQGEKYFYDMRMNVRDNIFSGRDAFKLYDTYGFPLEVTQVLAHSEGLNIDDAGYEVLMQEQRERSKINRNEQAAHKGYKGEATFPPTEFLGYELFEAQSKVNAIIDSSNNVIDKIQSSGDYVLMVDKSVFYVQSGGQISDKGIIDFNGSRIIVKDVIKVNQAIGLIVNTDLNITQGSVINQIIDKEMRAETAAHHTAVHILQAVLREKYGKDVVKQAGSYVCDSYFTFDCSLGVLPSSEELLAIEKTCNEIIIKNLLVVSELLTYDEAIARGALAFFSDKYDRAKVRMVSIDTISQELCGGTHAPFTGFLHSIILFSPVSVASGVRRFTGKVRSSAMKEHESWHETVLHIVRNYKSSASNTVEALKKIDQDGEKIQKKLTELQYQHNDDVVNIFIPSIEKNDSLIKILLLKSDEMIQAPTILRSIQNKRPGLYAIIGEHNERTSLLIGLADSFNVSFSMESLGEELQKEYDFKGKIKQNSIIGSALFYNKKNFSLFEFLKHYSQSNFNS